MKTYKCIDKVIEENLFLSRQLDGFLFHFSYMHLVLQQNSCLLQEQPPPPLSWPTAVSYMNHITDCMVVNILHFFLSKALLSSPKSSEVISLSVTYAKSSLASSYLLHCHYSSTLQFF